MSALLVRGVFVLRARLPRGPLDSFPSGKIIPNRNSSRFDPLQPRNAQLIDNQPGDVDCVNKPPFVICHSLFIPSPREANFKFHNPTNERLYAEQSLQSQFNDRGFESIGA